MKKKIIPLLLCFATLRVAHALSVDDADPAVVDRQETQPDTYVPLVQNYFSFMCESLRLDRLWNLDTKEVPFNNIKKFDWPSLFRGDGAILYAIPLNQSRFAFCIGMGWSTLYYSFASIKDGGNDYGPSYPKLKRKLEGRTECENMVSKKGKVLLGSAIKIPFMDVLFRLRFNSVLGAPKEGFHAWFGFKFGFRRRASMLIDYSAYDDSGASSVDNGYFNLNLCTVGLQTGIGYSRFGVTGGYHFMPLFKEKEGPSRSELLRPYFVGIYVDLL